MYELCAGLWAALSYGESSFPILFNMEYHYSRSFIAGESLLTMGSNFLLKRFPLSLKILSSTVRWVQSVVNQWQVFHY
jgi:hypothetical protein